MRSLLDRFGAATPEPAEATHRVAPVRRPERASAEAEVGAAWTVARNRRAAALAGAPARLPVTPKACLRHDKGSRAPILPTVKIGGIPAFLHELGRSLGSTVPLVSL